MSTASNTNNTDRNGLSGGDPSQLSRFRQARKVFDECDSLRETYWNLQQRGETGRCQEILSEMKQLLDTLGLDKNGKGMLGFEEEEEALQWSYTRGEERGECNRWANVRPWDHAMLPPPYLNATPVPPLTWPTSEADQDLHLPQQSFIASQAPLPNTFSHFWHHFISSRSHLLVNLTPVYDAYGLTKVRKSHQYWPDSKRRSFDAGQGWKVELIEETRHTTRQSPAQVQRGTQSSKADDGSVGGTTSSSQGKSTSAERSTIRAKIHDHASQRGYQDSIPDKDWTIFKRELLVHPPMGWKPAPVEEYLKVLHPRRFGDKNKALAASSSSLTSPSSSSSISSSRQFNPGSGWPVTLLHVDAWADGGADSGVNFCRLVDLVEETQRALTDESDRKKAQGGNDEKHSSSSSLSLSSRTSTTSSSPQPPAPPIWVHCSAGIGRTGTLIAGLLARPLVLTTTSTTSTSTSATSRNIIQSLSPEEIVLLLWRYLRTRRYGMITTPQQAKMVADEIVRLRHAWGSGSGDGLGR